MGYKAVEKETLFPETTVSFNETQGVFIAQFDATGSLEIGQKYCVVWDGEEYVCEGILHGDFCAIGNATLLGVGTDDTGEPFYIVDNVNFSVVTLDESATHIITIYTVGEVIHTIPAEYLPDVLEIKCDITAYNLFTTLSLVACDFGDSTVEHAAQMLLENRAVIVTNDDRRYTPCSVFDYDINGNPIVQFTLLHNTSDKVYILHGSLGKMGYLVPQRILAFAPTETIE